MPRETNVVMCHPDPYGEPAFAVKVGDRVELHPATDLWMMGDRCGEVVDLNLRNVHGYDMVHVRLDVSGKRRRFEPSDIGKKL